MALHVWEHVDPDTRRMPVPGGWIYETTGSQHGVDESAAALTLAFVPEPDEAVAAVLKVAVEIGTLPGGLGNAALAPAYIATLEADLRAAVAKLDAAP